MKIRRFNENIERNSLLDEEVLNGFSTKRTGLSNIDCAINDTTGYQFWYKNVKAKVVKMSPDEYLRKVREGFKSDGDVGITDGSLNRIRQAIENGNIIDMPHLDYRNGRLSQEGRNRAWVARELGIDEIPVAIINDVTNQDHEIDAKQILDNAFVGIPYVNSKDEFREMFLQYARTENLHRDVIYGVQESKAFKNKCNKLMSGISESKKSEFNGPPMKAYLVCLAPMTRVVAPEYMSQEDVIQLSVPLLIERLKESPIEDLEEIKDDDEIPFGEKADDYVQQAKYYNEWKNRNTGRFDL